MNIKDYLIHTFEKSGISNNEAVRTLLLTIQDNEAFNNEESIPIEIANIAKQNLISVQDAKMHPDVSASFKKSYFDKIDQLVTSNLSDDNDILSEVNQIKNTEERINKAFAKLKEAKNNGKDKNSTIEALNTRINELQTVLATQKTEFEKSISEKENRIQQIYIDTLKENSLNSFNFRKDLTFEQSRMLAKNEIERKINELGARIVYENNAIVLKQKDSELEYMDVQQGKKITYSELMRDVMQNSNLIEVTPPNEPTKTKEAFRESTEKKSVLMSQMERVLQNTSEE